MTADSVVTGDVKKSGHSREKSYVGDDRASAFDKSALGRGVRSDSTPAGMQAGTATRVDRVTAEVSIWGAPLWIGCEC